jgi:hypothetical protein
LVGPHEGVLEDVLDVNMGPTRNRSHRTTESCNDG